MRTATAGLREKVFKVLIKKERVTIMKKVKNIFHKIANADPMIWGYVMLNEINRK